MATLDEIETALRNAHKAGDAVSAQRLANAYTQQKSAQLSNEGTSVGSRFVQGMAEPMEGLTQAVTRALPSNMNIRVPAISSEGISLVDVSPEQVAKFGENKRAEQAKRNEAAGVGTNVAGALGNIASPLNMIMAARNPVVSGAIGGILAPANNQTDESFWPEKASQATTGALTSGALGAGAKAVENAFRGATPSKYAQMLMKEGVTLTPGQIIGGRANITESKLESLPIIGDAIANARQKGYEEFNKVALNRALAPIGEATDKVGREGVQDVSGKLNKYYDDILPNLTFIPDEEFAQNLTSIQQQQIAKLPKKERQAYANIIERVNSKADENGVLTGKAFKQLESVLKQESNRFGSSSDGYQQELGDALNQTLTAYKDVLPRANPEYAGELAKANQGWANYSRIRSAASNANEGIFTPQQLAQAVRSQDKSVGKGASAKGTALMQDLSEAASNVLPSKYPNSGTASRLIMDALVAGSVPLTPTLAAGLGAGATPYLARETTQALLTKRPEIAKQIADVLRQTAKYPVAASPYLINESGEQ